MGKKALIDNSLSMKMDLTKVQISTARTLFESIKLLSCVGQKVKESVMKRHIKIKRGICNKRLTGDPRRLPTD